MQNANRTATLSVANVRLTAMSAAMHLMVDGLCICCLYLTTLGDEKTLVMFLLYNVLAFLTQPLTGLYADRMRRPHWMLLAAVALLTLAVVMAAVSVQVKPSAQLLPTLLMVVLLGMGNSLFHVWGGKQVAVRTQNDIRALGVFVSPGVLGLAIGAVCSSWVLLYAFLLGICGVAVLYVWVERKEVAELMESLDYPGYPEYPGSYGLPHALTIDMVSWLIGGLMLFVAFRSYAGEGMTSGIAKGTALLFAFSAVSMLGKMAGGWLARWMGEFKAMACVLVGAIVCFFLRDCGIAVVVAGLFLINCTMPITLYWANVLLKSKEGLAFGLLAAALIPGYLLAMMS